jgi:hypothetical protein
MFAVVGTLSSESLLDNSRLPPLYLENSAFYCICSL